MLLIALTFLISRMVACDRLWMLVFNYRFNVGCEDGVL